MESSYTYIILSMVVFKEVILNTILTPKYLLYTVPTRLDLINNCRIIPQYSFEVYLHFLYSHACVYLLTKLKAKLIVGISLMNASVIICRFEKLFAQTWKRPRQMSCTKMDLVAPVVMEKIEQEGFNNINHN